MVRALKKLGFVNERQVGSHVRMVKGNTPLKTGLLRSQMKIAGLVEADLKGEQKFSAFISRSLSIVI